MILDAEGFDRETNVSLANWFVATSGTPAISADGTGWQSYGRYLSGGVVSISLGSNRSDAIWMQGHFYFTALTTNIFLGFADGTSSGGCNLRPTASGALEIIRSSTGSLFTSSAGILSLNTWHFIQMRVVLSNTAGECEVWLDGVQIANIGPVDNTTSANNYGNTIAMGSATCRVDNFICYDTTGDAPTSRTPETRVFEDVSDGDGAVVEMTPLSGTNSSQIDEQPNDGDTSYVSAGSAPLTDVYSYPSTTVPAATIVYAVGVRITARKDDAGGNEIDGAIRPSSTVSVKGSNSALTTSYQRFKRFWTQNPETAAAWTVGEANATHVGQRRVV